MGATNTAFGHLVKHDDEHVAVNETPTETMGRNAVKTLSAARILFGAIFLFDGALKWLLFAQGNMQATVQSFGISYLSNNWVLVGALVGLGETFGGVALMMGLFQRLAAIWSAAIMFLIWAFGGYGGLYVNGVFSLNNQTDPGGDLMLALIFVVLVFAPYAYGLASRLRIRERFAGSSLGAKLARWTLT